jgi:hypothetical protein
MKRSSFLETNYGKRRDKKQRALTRLEKDSLVSIRNQVQILLDNWRVFDFDTGNSRLLKVAFC